MDWVTTSTLLRDLRDFRNEAAWERFVQRFREPIVRFARGIGVPERGAEDVAQETLVAFAEAYRAGRYDRGKGRLSQWLFGIAYRQAHRQRRRDARPEGLVPAGSEGERFWEAIPDERTATPIWQMEWEDFVLKECFDRARLEFEPSTIEIFESLVRDGRPAAEVAQAAGVTVGAVYNIKHRVLRRMKDLRPELEEL
jgi:RNA polymerase sigma-70 factor (ECF subfamily)